MPSFADVKAKVGQHLPDLPQMPDVSQYLPELPSIPDIPLPEPLDKVRNQINFYDGQYVSPLIQRVNYVILIFSIP